MNQACKLIIAQAWNIIETQGTVARGEYHDGSCFCIRGALVFAADPDSLFEAHGNVLVGFAWIERRNESLREIYAAAHELLPGERTLQDVNDYEGYDAVISLLKKLATL